MTEDLFTGEDTTKGTRLPKDWQPVGKFAAFCVERDMTPTEIKFVADEFRNYWIAKPGQGALKRNWLATWENRVREWLYRQGRPTDPPPANDGASPAKQPAGWGTRFSRHLRHLTGVLAEQYNNGDLTFEEYRYRSRQASVLAQMRAHNEVGDTPAERLKLWEQWYEQPLTDKERAECAARDTKDWPELQDLRERPTPRIPPEIMARRTSGGTEGGRADETSAARSDALAET